MVVHFNVSNAPVPDGAGPFSRLFVYAPLNGLILAFPGTFVIWLALGALGVAAPNLSPNALTQALRVSDNELASRIYWICAGVIAVIAAFAGASEARRRVPIYRLSMGELNAALQKLRKRVRAPASAGRVWGWLNLALALGVWQFANQKQAWTLDALRAQFPLVFGCSALIAIFVVNGLRLLMSGPSLGRSAASLGLRVLGVLAALAAFVATTMLISMVGLLVLRNQMGDGAIALIVMASMLMGGFAAYKSAQWVDGLTNFKASRLGAGTAQDRLRGDKRKPVLFLRSFKDDAARAPSVDQPKDSARDFVRLENVIAQATNYGPLIAVGEPGTIPKGIARDYYQGDDWQEAVKTWMDQALLIVMVAGFTEGVRWEFERAIAGGHARKLILVFPPNDRNFEARWAWVRHLLGNRVFGPAMDQANRQNAIVLCTDSSDQLCVMTSRTPTSNDYRAALALAVYGKLVRTG